MENLPSDESRRLFDRMSAVMPAGSTRSTAYYAPYPVALARGSGYVVVDVDGNEYIDGLSNYSALVHGQAHPAIVEAIERAAALGYANPAPMEIQAELAERIYEAIPAVGKVRFTNSGTEAVMIAARAARAFTGRDRLVKAIGGYHGSWEQLAIGASEDQDVSAGTAGGAPGVPVAIEHMLSSVAYNDVEHLEEIFERHGPEIAALIVEPVLGHVIEPATDEYLRRARELCDANGALLVFDEVITLRLHRGGVQTLLGITPDLTTMGKIIGGGLPVGAIGGSDEVMAIFDPRNGYSIEHHGTSNGNPLSMAAGVVTLDLLSQEEIDRINALGAKLAEGLAEALDGSGLRALVTSSGSLVNIRGDAADVSMLHRAALEAGVYMAPRGMLCISTPMDDAVVSELLARLAVAVEAAASRVPVAP